MMVLKGLTKCQEIQKTFYYLHHRIFAVDVIDYFNSLSNISLKVILHYEKKEEKLYGYRSAINIVMKMILLLI